MQRASLTLTKWTFRFNYRFQLVSCWLFRSLFGKLRTLGIAFLPSVSIHLNETLNWTYEHLFAIDHPMNIPGVTLYNKNDGVYCCFDTRVVVFRALNDVISRHFLFLSYFISLSVASTETYIKWSYIKRENKFFYYLRQI